MGVPGSRFDESGKTGAADQVPGLGPLVKSCLVDPGVRVPAVAKDDQRGAARSADRLEDLRLEGPGGRTRTSPRGGVVDSGRRTSRSHRHRIGRLGGQWWWWWWTERPPPLLVANGGGGEGFRAQLEEEHDCQPTRGATIAAASGGRRRTMLAYAGRRRFPSGLHHLHAPTAGGHGNPASSTSHSSRRHASAAFP